MVKIKVSVQTNRIGSRIEDVIDVHVENSMNEREVENAKEAAAREWMFENIEWGWMDVENEIKK